MSKRILLLLFILAMPPTGIGQDDYHLARTLMEEGVVLPLGVIIAQARRDGMTGRVIDVKFHHHLDHYIYHVQVLDDTGLIHGVIFDATNGAVLDIHGD